MDWEECRFKKIIKEVKPDENMIKSLKKSSKNKMESESKLEMDDITSISKLSLTYDSLRELLEALAIKKGFRIYNHECYTAFLKEIIKESEKGSEFDRIRIIRNAVNYYGKELTIGEASGIIERIKKLRNFVSNLLEGLE